jgi:S-methylmethionine-dependent homocysteine/selenocysteine methylase
MMAYPEKQEEISEETESKLKHQEVPKEEATVETVTALKKQHGNRQLIVGCCEKPNRPKAMVDPRKVAAAAKG